MNFIAAVQTFVFLKLSSAMEEKIVYLEKMKSSAKLKVIAQEDFSNATMTANALERRWCAIFISTALINPMREIVEMLVGDRSVMVIVVAMVIALMKDSCVMEKLTVLMVTMNNNVKAVLVLRINLDVLPEHVFRRTGSVIMSTIARICLMNMQHAVSIKIFHF